jgi:transposase
MGRSRRRISKQEKRRIVDETLKPGASVSVVARQHDINANQLFRWRRLYREGHLEVETESRLLPVRISDVVEKIPQQATARASRRVREGTIDIDLGHARVRIEGTADPACVRAALEGLLR